MSSNSIGLRRASCEGHAGVNSRLAMTMAAVVMATAPPAYAEEPAAPADGVAVAEQKAAEAFEAYSKADYPTAVGLYLQAYKAAASAPILYNVARIYDAKLGDRAQASAFYRRYIDSPDARPDLIETARRRLALLAAPGTADPREGDKLEPRGAPAGAEGRLVAPPGDATPQPRAARSTGHWMSLAFGAAGLVAIGVGGGFGLAARSDANTAHQLCNGNVCGSQAGVDAARAGKRDAIISDIAFGVGGALLLTGTVLYLLGEDRSSESEARARLHVEARADASAWALQLAGRW